LTFCFLEHQFLVAVNTISLVKNEAIFTYLAPTNLITWILHPLRFVISFRTFVKLNRTIVKITHLPLLAAIYLYETTMMRNSTFVPADAIRSGRSKLNNGGNAQGRFSENRMHSTVRRLQHKDSVGSQQQERVLEEVFAAPYRRVNVRTDRSEISGRPGESVASWIMAASPPTEVEGAFGGIRRIRNANKRPDRRGRVVPSRVGGVHANYGSIVQNPTAPNRDISVSRSARSDPEIFATGTGAFQDSTTESDPLGTRTDDDADNEENSGEEYASETNEESAVEVMLPKLNPPQNVSTPHQLASNPSRSSPTAVAGREDFVSRGIPRPPFIHQSRHHERINSTNTTPFGPEQKGLPAIATPLSSPPPPSSKNDNQPESPAPHRGNNGGTGGYSLGWDIPKARPSATSRSRPTIAPRNQQFVPSSVGPDGLRLLGEMARHRPSPGPSVLEDFANHDKDMGLQIPSSFATQMAIATGKNDVMWNRMVLAKIGALEEGMKDIKEILKEAKKIKSRDRKEKGKGKKGVDM
jgi:hypothetical protein